MIIIVKKIKELNDKLLRALAESENLRKNQEKEKEDIIKFGASTFALTNFSTY